MHKKQIGYFMVNLLARPLFLSINCLILLEISKVLSDFAAISLQSLFCTNLVIMNSKIIFKTVIGDDYLMQKVCIKDIFKNIHACSYFLNLAWHTCIVMKK